jgi:hypothetical protein
MSAIRRLREWRAIHSEAPMPYAELEEEMQESERTKGEESRAKGSDLHGHLQNKARALSKAKYESEKKQR